MFLFLYSAIGADSCLEPGEGCDGNTPAVAGADVVGSGEGALVDGHRQAVQGVDVDQGFAYIYIREAALIYDDVAVDGAGVILDGDAQSVTVLGIGFQE